ncbi:MAG: 4Fe-4S dicluster domain-containing protein [Deltaproteobacteria bacterium]|nr:4Fe-4S dicluster domain-containing protein [Deltaproteobacteria bacterium]
MKGLLIDVTRCIGCWECSNACAKANSLPPVDSLTRATGADLSADRFTVLRKVELGDRGRRYVRRMCMHCLEPTCASVCPVGALHRTPQGPVVYEVDRCIGCRYCIMACPHNVPRYEWDEAAPRVRKCVLCAPRVARGEPTACAAACPMAATVFGDRKELLAEARRRMVESPDLYEGGVFGEWEAGGTGVLFLSDVPFGSIGFPSNLPDHPLGANTEAVLSHLPDVLLIGGSLLFGLQWIIHRRDKLAEEAEAVVAEGAAAKEDAAGRPLVTNGGGGK